MYFLISSNSLPYILRVLFTFSPSLSIVPPSHVGAVSKSVIESDVKNLIIKSEHVESLAFVTSNKSET